MAEREESYIGLINLSFVMSHERRIEREIESLVDDRAETHTGVYIVNSSHLLILSSSPSEESIEWKQ